MSGHLDDIDVMDLARASRSNEPQDRAALGHLDECPECRARLVRQQELDAGLRALAATAPEMPSADVMERRLLEAFALRHPAAVSAPRVPPQSWRLLAAAAVLILAVAAAWSDSWRQAEPACGPGSTPCASRPEPGPSGPPQAARAELPPAASEQAEPPAPALPPPARQPARPAGQWRPRPPAAPPAVRLAEFTPLPAAAGMPEFESGRIVRVELPVSILPAYGLGMVPDALRSPVEADVLVGQDGQPRAIRLVGTQSDTRSRQ